MLESQDKQKSDWRAYAAKSETDASPEHQRIRAALLGLPRETTPVGFEFRLMQRIEGKTSPRTRTSSNWMLGWAGAGLGLAVAMFVSFAAFDINFSDDPGSAGTIAKSAQEVPATTLTDDSQMAAEKSTTVERAEPQLLETDVELASTPEDSAGMIRRGEIPRGLDQTVSDTRETPSGGK